jgi:REP element-mobilizing transposase RayT
VAHRQELYVHLVWSTWNRLPLLGEAVRPRVWATIGAEARRMGCAWAVVGGVDDHVHMLCALPAGLAVSTLAKQVKGACARSENVRTEPYLRWQGGYAAFSVSPSAVPEVEAYVRDQAAIHAARAVHPDIEPA